MPHQLFWLVPQRMTFLQVDTVGLAPQQVDNDLIEYDGLMVEMFKSCDQSPSAPPIHLMADMRSAFYLPPLWIQRRLQFPHHAKLGWALMVGINNPVVNAILNIAPRMFRMPVRTFKTLEDAFNFIQEMDPTLPDLAPHAREAGLNINLSKLIGKRASS